MNRDALIEAFRNNVTLVEIRNSQSKWLSGIIVYDI